MTKIPSSVIAYYSHQTGTPVEQAILTFKELEQFLARAANRFQRPSKNVDEAWHTFILHTEEYSKYCLVQFGKFIHHIPDTLGEKQNEESKCSNCSSNCRGSD
jgi:hypothetical protein